MLSFESATALSFDCYGTLIDWETGLLNAFASLLRQPVGELDSEDLLARFARIEAEIESGEYLPYRAVLARTAQRIGGELRSPVSPDASARFADSLRDWPPFSDTVAALRKLATRYRLFILSNVDDDLFAYSAAKLGVEFAGVLTAQQLGSYKPDRRNFAALIERVGEKHELIHVAQSLFHDHVPAQAMGLKTVWVNRRGEPLAATGGATAKASEARFDLEVPDLRTLARMAVG